MPKIDLFSKNFVTLISQENTLNRMFIEISVPLLFLQFYTKPVSDSSIILSKKNFKDKLK